VTHREPVRPLLLGLGWSPDQPGGLNRYFRDLLAALGDAAAVVVGPAGDPLPGTVVVSDHAAPLVERLRAFSRAAAADCATTDVVDAHFALYAALPVRLGPLRRRPLVVHFQGPWAREAAATGGVGRGSVFARALVERSVYRHAARVVTLSGAFGRLVARDYGVSPWRIDIVRPGVDLDRFRPGDMTAARAEFGLAPDVPVVLAVRRLVPRTGVDGLIDAWRGLDDGAAVLVLAGEGPERPALEARVRAHGLRYVRFLGAVPDAQLPTLYRAADLCVVPSVALEGFGLVVLESLASGTPVLVTDVGGLPEAVAGLDADVVVAAGDAGALGDRIARALDGRSPLPTRVRCREHAEQFSWTAAAARHRRVYAEAITPPTRARVLFVDHCARLSGGEIAMLRLARELSTVDAHVVVFEDGPLLAALGAAGITSEIIAMPARTRDLRRQQVGVRLPWRAAVDTVLQVVRLARRIRRLRPDVVHANSLKACIVAGIAARLARVPCVWHVRDRIDTDSLPRPAIAFVRALARRVPSAIVANSASTLASLRLPSVPSRVVIADPLPDEFFVAPATARRDEPVIGMVGRLAPWKGQHVFLDAFARAFPSGGVRARIVGDALFGEDEYRDSLHEQVARLGLDDRIEFRGFRTDVRAELGELDILVHASVQPEPFGQVVVEGMAAGLPVIATDAGGPAEIVDRGLDGLLVPPGDIAALAVAMRSLVDDAARRDELGCRARVSAARYRAEVIVPRFAELYDDIGTSR